MSVFSKLLICICASALVAGCGSAPHRSGKGNDHEIVCGPAYVDEREVDCDR